MSMLMMMMTEQRCKNGGTDRHVVWDGTDRGRDRFVGPKQLYVTRDTDYLTDSGTFEQGHVSAAGP